MNVCPIPGCGQQKRSTQVMCKTHWFQVPKELRDAVWNEYRTENGSPEHLEAVHQAIRSVLNKGAA